MSNQRARAALAAASDRHAVRRIDAPRSGYFTIRLVKGGPPVPARIVFDFLYAAEIDGVRTGPAHADPDQVPQLLAIWHYGTEISAAEHDSMVARKATRPDPRRPVDFGTMPSPF